MLTTGKLMTDIYIAIPHDATVKDVTKKMRDASIGSLLVEKDNEYVGIVTEPDVVRKVDAMGRDHATTLVSDIMSSPLISVDVNTPLREALTVMAHKEIRHLALSRGGKISGFLSVRDVLAYMISALPELSVEKPVGMM